MARTGGPRFRAAWRNIHLWIGVGLFGVLAPLGLTGSLLLWDDGLDRLAHPARYTVSAGALAPGAYVDAAARAFHGRAAPAQLRMPQAPGLPVTVNGFAPAVRPGQRPPSLTAWIDPASARVIEVADPRRELRGVIHNIHGNLMLPRNGRPVVGWLGVAMLVSCITGLCVWWPRNNALLRKALRWTRSPSAFSNLHHMAGFWICIPLAVLSLSGAYIAFPQAMRALFAAGPAAGAQRPGFSPSLPAPEMNADQALAAALRADDALAGARLVSITLPTAGGKPAWRVQLKPVQGAAMTVRVDDASGRTRVQAEGGDSVARFMRRLHDGSAYGPVWRIVIALAGAAPTLLGVTGIAVWLGRRKISASRRY
jgi:uncharacterized iron-regulated membrane protein